MPINNNVLQKSLIKVNITLIFIRSITNQEGERRLNFKSSILSWKI